MPKKLLKFAFVTTILMAFVISVLVVLQWSGSKVASNQIQGEKNISCKSGTRLLANEAQYTMAFLPGSIVGEKIEVVVNLLLPKNLNEINPLRSLTSKSAKQRCKYIMMFPRNKIRTHTSQTGMNTDSVYNSD